MKISVVTTLYNSAPHLVEFYKRMTDTVKELTHNYEILLVNDSSPDKSLEVALKLYDHDPNVKIIDLSRNFGEHKAIMTGLMHAEGDFIFLIQSDLEVSPSYFTDFWNDLISSKDIDIINGIQESRRGNWYERIVGGAFYRLFNALSDVQIGWNAGCRLMTRRFVNALISHQERTIFFGGLCVSTGFGQKTHLVKKSRTRKGSYTLSRNFQMIADAITSFSYLPLQNIFYGGCLISLFAFSYIAIILVNKIFLSIPINGWTSLIISIWFFGGLITASIGLIGIYLSRIFLEVKQRPYTIIKHIYDNTTRPTDIS